jgi:penicillin G amidase
MSALQQIVAPVTGVALGLLARSRRATYAGEIRLPGLAAPVEVRRDAWGVSHIYGRTITDLMFAQGFVHAQDRLWQMDYQRRVVAGRLAEVLGPVVLPADQSQRILGLRRVAEAEVTSIEDGVLCAELEAYSAGVNACIEREPLPVEFALLRYEPEPWTPVDSLSWAKMISWGLSINWETELLRKALIDRLGPELAAEFELPWPAHWPVVTPSAARHLPEQQPLPSPPTRIRPAPEAGSDDSGDERAGSGFPPMGAASGSNNWVVAGSRSTSGMPLLANDMHLPLTAPAIWYENHLCAEAERLNVTGVSFPGIPYVVSGHNGHVAWGFTNGYPDVQDLFVEHLRRSTAGDRVEYEFRGEWRPADVRMEVIRVKGQEPVLQEVIRTHHGPIINALAPGLAAPFSASGLPEEPLALRWTSLDPDTMLDAIRGLNQARSCVEVREALRGWASPIQNVVYADVHGDTGYSYPGRVPIRAAGDGRLPVSGWTGEYEWLGYVPFEDLPHQRNPAAGYIASANNRPVDDLYPHLIGFEFSMGDRAQRIVELLESRPKFDAADFRAMHLDHYAPSLHLMARRLGRLEADDPDLAPLVRLLAEWDGHLTADSAAGAVCETFVRLLGWVILEARLGDGMGAEGRVTSLVARLMGAGPTSFIQESTFFAHRTLEWLLALIDWPDSPWYDLGHGESRDDVLRLVMRGVHDYLERRLGAPGPAFANWTWGHLHTVSFAHVVGSVPTLASYFNRGPFPMGGDSTTVWATGGGFMPADSTKVIGPPFRFIADLSDLSKSQGLLAPGNSGRPDSVHYDDQVRAWFEGEYHPMLYAREDVERGTKELLLLSI